MLICLTRICTSLGLHVKFKTLFKTDKEKHDHHSGLPHFLTYIKAILGPRDLSALLIERVLKTCKICLAKARGSFLFYSLVYPHRGFHLPQKNSLSPHHICNPS